MRREVHAHHAALLSLALLTLAPCLGGCTALVEFGTRAVFDPCVFEDCIELPDGTRDCATSKPLDDALYGVLFQTDITGGDHVYVTSPFENLEDLPRLYLCVEPGNCVVATDENPGEGAIVNFSLAGAGSDFELDFTGGELALAADRDGAKVCSFVRWGARGLEAPFTFEGTEPEDWRGEAISIEGIPAPSTIVRVSGAPGAEGWRAGEVSLEP